MNRGRNGQRGMTLVEVMVVATVMVIISAVAIPLYQDYIKTSRQSAVVNKAEAFRAFMDNHRLNTGTYVAGVYDPTADPAVNDFGDPLVPENNIGYRVDGDNSDFSFQTEAGDCGSITECYRLNVSRDGAVMGTYESSTGTWVWF